jgi:hypothetical protein
MILPKPEELEIEGLDIAGYMNPPMKWVAITTMCCTLMASSRLALVMSPGMDWKRSSHAHGSNRRPHPKKCKKTTP